MDDNHGHHHNPIVEEIVEVERAATGMLAAHKLMVMVCGAVVVSMILVAVSLSLYNSSGTALLDLSLPGLADARKQVTRNEENVSFSPTGEISKQTMTEFSELYDERVKQIADVDAFSIEPVSDEALSIDDAATD